MFGINPHSLNFQLDLQYMLQMKEYSKKLTSYLLQNDVVLYFEFYWKRENMADINFWDFNKLND